MNIDLLILIIIIIINNNNHKDKNKNKNNKNNVKHVRDMCMYYRVIHTFSNFALAQAYRG